MNNEQCKNCGCVGSVQMHKGGTTECVLCGSIDGRITTAERATPAAASAGAAGMIANDPKLWTLVNECHAGYQYGPATRHDEAKKALAAHIDQHTAAAMKAVQDELDEWRHTNRVDELEREVARLRTGQAQATEGGDLTEAQIVDVLASLGIDSEKSRHGFDVLQVHTTVPAIRDIVKAYRAATAPVSAAPTAGDRAKMIDSMCMTWRHDFGLDRLPGDVIGSGMSEGQRDSLRRQMGQIYDHHFTPAFAALPQSSGAPVSAAPRTKVQVPDWLKRRAGADGFEEILAYGAARADEVMRAFSVAPVSAAEPRTAVFMQPDTPTSDTHNPVVVITDYRQPPADGQELPAPTDEELAGRVIDYVCEHLADSHRRSLVTGVAGLLAMRQPQPLPTTYSLIWESARMEPDPAGEWVKHADLAMGQQGALVGRIDVSQYRTNTSMDHDAMRALGEVAPGNYDVFAIAAKQAGK